MPPSLRHIAIPMAPLEPHSKRGFEVVDATIAKRLAQLHAALEPNGAMLVFVDDESCVPGTLEGLRSRKFSCAALTAHHPKERKARAALLRKIKSSRVQVVLATEMGARGLDLTGVHTVVNLTPPNTVRQYVHRAGRAARMAPHKGPIGNAIEGGPEAPMAAEGVAVTFVPALTRPAGEEAEQEPRQEEVQAVEVSSEAEAAGQRVLSAVEGLGAGLEWCALAGGRLVATERRNADKLD